MRKVIGFILVFILSSFSVLSFVYAENITDLQTKQDELRNQITSSNEELEGVQGEISENLEQLQRLDEKIENSQKELEELNTKIDDLLVQIDEVESKLNLAEEQYNKRKDLLEERLVQMYKAGDIQYLEVILSSKSISDFLSNYFLITELANYDTELLESVEKQKNEIELEKAKLDKTRQEYASIKQNQTKTAKILENTKSVRENYIAKLSEDEKALQAKIEEYNQAYAQVNAEILALAMEGLDSTYIGGELEWPVPGYTRITSKYGIRYHPILHINRLHSGLDIGAPMGANFVAANDGIVTKAEMTSGYGNMVMIDHGGGIATLYAHGSEILVKPGQVVKRGEAILKVGSTGMSTGPHAHFEVRINGQTTDPLPYVTTGVIPGTENKTENTTEQNSTENTTKNETEKNATN